MDFITLRTFSNYIDAHIALSRLQEEELGCWLKDENTVTTTGLPNAFGGIKLLVRQEDAEKAEKVLSDITSSD
jgi:hypothetical protein